MRILVVDNYDSFTFNLVQQLLVVGKQWGVGVDTLLNDTNFAKVSFEEYSGVVISPGPGVPKNSGISLDVIQNQALPLLGVCLGHQAIGYLSGAEIRQAKFPLHGKASPISHDGKGLFHGIPSPFSAARYHSLVIDGSTLSNDFMVTARSEDGEIMAISHKHKKLWGVQFHPESFLTKHGDTLIRNFLDYCAHGE